jgi:hypothetical protein
MRPHGVKRLTDFGVLIVGHVKKFNRVSSSIVLPTDAYLDRRRASNIHQRSRDGHSLLPRDENVIDGLLQAGQWLFESPLTVRVKFLIDFPIDVFQERILDA